MTLRIRVGNLFGIRIEAVLVWGFLVTVGGFLVALEKFGEVFRSCGLSGLYEFWSGVWFSWEEWEAFARSGRMRTTGTGFD